MAGSTGIVGAVRWFQENRDQKAVPPCRDFRCVDFLLATYKNMDNSEKAENVALQAFSLLCGKSLIKPDKTEFNFMRYFHLDIESYQSLATGYYSDSQGSVARVYFFLSFCRIFIDMIASLTPFWALSMVSLKKRTHEKRFFYAWTLKFHMNAFAIFVIVFRQISSL